MGIHDIALMQRLRQLGTAYRMFLTDSNLRDEPLARMTFFWTAKKTYLDDPVESVEEQAAILKHLDAWMTETYKEMLALMPPAPGDAFLYTIHKRLET